MSTEKTSAGRVLIVPRGDWNAETTYEMLDLVNHNGYAYLAKQTVVGLEPETHSEYWHSLLDIKRIVESNIAETVSDDVAKIVIVALEKTFGERIVNLEGKDKIIDKEIGLLKSEDENIKKDISDLDNSVYDKPDVLSDNTRELLHLEKGDTPDNAFNSLYDMQSVIPAYLVFVGETNTDLLDAAFGKNNEDNFKGVGKALAMYAWFKGLSKTDYPFNYLCKMQTLNDVNTEVYEEIIDTISHEDLVLYDFIKSSSYADDKIFDVFSYSGSHSNSSSLAGDDTVERIKQIEVTDDHLSTQFILGWSYSNANNSGSGTKLYINDVELTKGTASGKSGYFFGLQNWSDYNVSAPGTYNVRIVLKANNASTTTSGGYSIRCAKTK